MNVGEERRPSEQRSSAMSALFCLRVHIDDVVFMNPDVALSLKADTFFVIGAGRSPAFSSGGFMRRERYR